MTETSFFRTIRNVAVMVWTFVGLYVAIFLLGIMLSRVHISIDGVRHSIQIGELH